MTNDDRDDRMIMTTGWTEEDMAKVASEELAHAMAMRGIGGSGCEADGREVSVQFGSIHDAETLMTLAVPGPTGPGTLYDRATGGCVSLAELAAAHGDDASDGEVADIIDAGWVWMIHPVMRSHVAMWHVSVTLPWQDANTVTARLNALPFTDDTQ